MIGLRCFSRKYTMHLRLFLLVIAATQATAAWRTCEEQSFCKNTRDYLDGDRTFHLEDVEVNEIVTAKIIDDESVTYDFKLVALEGETLRLTIQDPINPRYTPAEDALVRAPTETGFIQESQNGDEPMVLSYGLDLKVNLHSDPFKIEVYKGDENIVNLNQRNGLLVNNNGTDRTVAIDVAFPIAQRAYGIPQHAERLSLPSTESTTPYRMFNVDYYGYPVFTKEAVYGSIGVLYGVSTTITPGVFWMNAAQTFVDIFNNDDKGIEAVFVSETGALELFVFGGPTLKEAVRQYTRLTGVGDLPQYYSLGYHQSRYSYMSQDDVEDVVEKMDENNFPMDTIWLDIDHTDGYKYFTWNPETFPDPEGMQNKIVDTGRKVVAISDPHLAVDDTYFVYREALEEDFLVKESNGEVLEAECWPGISSWVDYFNPDAQSWYAGLYSLTNYEGSTLNLYIWNDMNEPAVFNAVDNTFPDDAQHYGGWSHRDVHNMYGLKHTQATKSGLLARDPNKRPFILTRAHFAGSQRFSAMWTGDNQPTWEHLQISIPMVLTESLAGMSFCGADVGGFTGNVTDDLLQRWYQVGAWYPFFRGHSGINTERREPYLFDDEDIQERIRAALRVRYSHIPHWYTVFYEHERIGDPIARPLSYEYPEDLRVLDIDNQWLIGSDIMVAPVLEESVDTIRTYFPGGEDEYWYNIVDQTVYLGTGNYPIKVTMDSLPYYYRGGSIILTIDEDVNSTEGHKDQPYHMYVLLDSNGEARGNFYFDDWESFEYRNSKAYIYYRFVYADERLSVEKIDDEADYDGSFMLSQIDVYRPASGSSRAGIGEVEVKSALKDIKMGNLKANSTIVHRL